jgi:aspartate aminotransferase/aminotransferase
MVDTYPDFKLRAEAVERALTPRSKVLIVNSPSNPTGVALDRDEMKELAEVARRHNLLVISDDIYDQFHYDGPPATMAGLHTNTLVLNVFSKIAAMTGWRVGYAAGPKEIINHMNTLQQYTFVCAPSFAQHAAITALRHDPTEKINAYRRKRDLVYEGLADLGIEVVKPGGAFYIFPQAPNGDGDAFVKRAIENNLLIIPGSVFSERKTHFRISFAADDQTIRRGLAVLAKIREEVPA